MLDLEIAIGICFSEFNEAKRSIRRIAYTETESSTRKTVLHRNSNPQLIPWLAIGFDPSGDIMRPFADPTGCNSRVKVFSSSLILRIAAIFLSWLIA